MTCETVYVGGSGYVPSPNVLVFMVCVWVCVHVALAGISRWRLSIITGCGGVLLLWLLLYGLYCLEDKHYGRKGKRTRRKKLDV